MPSFFARIAQRWFWGKPKPKAQLAGPQVVRRTPSGRVVPAIATDPPTESRTWTFPPIKVESSNLLTVAFDYDSKTLEVQFLGGATYHYFRVDVSVYQGLMGAASKGAWLHQNVKTPKGRYDYLKVV